jgi:3-oxosteroid 1-dehydrogenase
MDRGEAMKSEDPSWDQDVDLLVVGSGAAGLTAALVGSNEGLRTLVIEKTELYGGTTSYSGGVVWVPNNPLMEKAGIRDTHEDALAYLRHNIGQRVAPVLLETFVREAPRMVDYIQSNSALQFELMDDFPDYRPETPGGHPGGRSINPKVFAARKIRDHAKLRARPGPLPGGIVGSVKELRRLAFFRSNPRGLLAVWTLFPRNLWNRLGGRKHVAAGRAIIARLRYTLQQKDVPIWLRTALTELVTEQGRVVGARVSRDGQLVSIRAKYGVMIAAGGFDHNAMMRERHFPNAPKDWTQGRYSLGSPGNTGDGIRAGSAAGAALDLMDDMWWMPSSVQPGAPAPSPHVFDRGLPHVIMVNSKGERFANEARPYNELGRVIFENASPPAWLVFDQRYRTRYALGTLLPGMTPERLIQQGYLKRADTIEALAHAAGIDAEGLTRTITRFNAMAEAGRDTDFAKGDSAFDRYAGDPAHAPNPCLGALGEAPFYAMEISAGDLGTKGGLLTNEHAQVLRTDGSVIEGLYAAGNSSACVMGNFYPGGGGTIGAGMTYAYVAAKHMARA